MLTKTSLKLALGAVIAMGAATGAGAADNAAEILFQRKHLELLKKGSEVAYRFQRTVSDTKLLGEPFSDDIKIGVTNVKPDETRDLEVKIFTGDRARDPAVFPDLTGNPLLIFYLDRTATNMSQLAGGERNFFKGKMRAALGDKATVEAVKVDVGGKSVDGYKVTVAPFVGDRNAAKMQGFDNARFAITVSDAAPGYLVDMVATYESSVKEAPRLEERISLVSSPVSTAGAAK